jgi:hypothetical protein
VKPPGDELPGKALVDTSPDFTHEARVQDVFVIGRQPDIVLLSLHFAYNLEWVAGLESN